MNGMLCSLTTNPHPAGGTQLVVFCESSRTTICHALHLRAANVAGIRALAAEALNSGDPAEVVHQIELIAGEISAQLDSLAIAIAQLQTAPAESLPSA